MSNVSSATQSFCCRLGNSASAQYFAYIANQPYARPLNSITMTMVIGASVGAKFVIVCGAPSSSTRKFSFFKPVKMSPFFVVAITSTVTTGTSTAIVTPASGGACVGGFAAGFCAAGGGGVGGALCCGCPPCGPAGACANDGCTANAQASSVTR